MRKTAKQRALDKYPKAYAKYVGLSLKFVIVADHGGMELSRHYSRERAAWADVLFLDSFVKRELARGKNE